jgi:uncharacterized membrane protein YraQ (UPF0718 family)
MAYFRQADAMNQALSFSTWLYTAWGVFMTTLTGLAFETIPFLLLGTLVSSIIHVFVPDTVIRRIFPRNRVLSILVALVAGAFIPICECGTVPLARRLREKGLPLSTAAAFLVAAPLANPMTIISTYVAFKGGPYPIYLFRVGFGLGAAFLIALAVEFLAGRDREKSSTANSPRFRAHKIDNAPGARLAALQVRSKIPAPKTKRPSLVARLAAVLDHTSRDFLDSARFLIAGISTAALVRALLPANAITSSLQHPLAAIGVGGLSAYLLSLCSSADAFVARSLFAPMSYPAALVFLMLGPMIDLKNSILLARFVKLPRLAAFIAIIVLICALVALAASPLFGGPA